MKKPYKNLVLEVRWRLSYVFFSLGLSFSIAYVSSSLLIYRIAKPLLRFDLERLREFLFTGFFDAFYTHISTAIALSVLFTLPLASYFGLLFFLPGIDVSNRPRFLEIGFGLGFLPLLTQQLTLSLILPFSYILALRFEETKGPVQVLVELSFRSLLVFQSQAFFILGSLSFLFGTFFHLVRAGQIASEALWRRRRSFLLGVFLSASFLAPPDFSSQLGLSLLGGLLFETGLFMALFWETLRRASFPMRAPYHCSMRRLGPLD